MTGTAEAGGLGRRVKELFHRLTSFKGGNAGGSIVGVHRNRKGGFMIIRIVGNHLTYLQPVKGLPVNGHTDKTPGVSRHEIYLRRSHSLSGNYDIPFIFSVFIINDHHHASVLNIVNSRFYCSKSHFIHS